MCDDGTRFHFNYMDRRFFVFCGSNHLRFEKTTTSAENCFLHTSQQTYHWILFEIFVGGIFWWPKGTDRAKSIENPTRINTLLTGTFSFLDWKVVEFWTVFFLLWILFCKKFLVQIKKNSKIWKNVNKVELHTYPSPDPKVTQAGYQLTVIGARGGVGAKFLRSRLTLIRTMNGKIKYKCE